MIQGNMWVCSYIKANLECRSPSAHVEPPRPGRIVRAPEPGRRLQRPAINTLKRVDAAQPDREVETREPRDMNRTTRARVTVPKLHNLPRGSRQRDPCDVVPVSDADSGRRYLGYPVRDRNTATLYTPTTSVQLTETLGLLARHVSRHKGPILGFLAKGFRRGLDPLQVQDG